MMKLHKFTYVISILQLILVCTVSLLFTACSLFEDDEQIAKPAQLSKLEPRVNVQAVWINKNGSGTDSQFFKLTPAIIDGKIFTCSYRGMVKAVDQETGKDLWIAKTNLPLTSGIGFDSHLLFIGTNSGKVIALHQDSGSIAWQATISNEVLATPVVAQDKVIVKTVDGKVLTFNAKTGDQLWSFKGSTSELILRGSSAPKIAGNLVISGFANGELVALNVNTGDVVWKQIVAEPTGTNFTERMTDIDADPVIINNVIYIATYQGQVAMIDLHGRILAQKTLSSYAGLTVGTKAVYAVAADGHIWAFAKNLSTKYWEQEELHHRDLSTPTIFNSALVVADGEGYVHWLDLENGKILARERPDHSGILVQPIVHDNSLYVMTKAGRLVKFKIG
jgi:outer membrane protein assembly factor BamB